MLMLTLQRVGVFYLQKYNLGKLLTISLLNTGELNCGCSTVWKLFFYSKSLYCSYLLGRKQRHNILLR